MATGMRQVLLVGGSLWPPTAASCWNLGGSNFALLVQEEALSNPDVVTKYKAAAKIVNSECRDAVLSSLLKSGRSDGSPRPCAVRADALAAVIEACKPGAKIVDLCDKGDTMINE